MSNYSFGILIINSLNSHKNFRLLIYNSIQRIKLIGIFGFEALRSDYTRI